MTETTLARFIRELNTYLTVACLNMAFGALAMAFSMQYAIMSVLGLTAGIDPALRMILAAVSLAGFGLGLAWIVSSARMLRGIAPVRREYRHRSGPVAPETLTCWIVRVMTHYRQNRETIRWMILICAVGGSAYLLAGLLNLYNGITGLSSAGTMWGAAWPFLAAGINLAIGMTSLISSYYLRKYSAAWDARDEVAAHAECALQQALEPR